MRETLGFPFQNGRFVKPEESRVSQARFWKRDNLYSESITVVTYSCEPNLVGSRFSSVNPEFLSVSSPFL